MAAALQIWSPTFSKAFDSLPESARDAVQRKVDDVGAQVGLGNVLALSPRIRELIEVTIHDLGSRLSSSSHHRLKGRSEYGLRAGDDRIIYEFDQQKGFCGW